MCIGTALTIRFDYDSPGNDSIQFDSTMHCDASQFYCTQQGTFFVSHEAIEYKQSDRPNNNRFYWLLCCPTKAKCSNYANIETEKNAFKVFTLASQTCCRYNSGDTFNEYLYRKEHFIEKEKTNDIDNKCK